MKIAQRFSDLARGAAILTGHPGTFLLAVFILVIWGLTGPFFGFSDTWQLVINTGTSVITFLMVFLIQSSQNRDTIAINVKLDELIRAIKAARNSVIDLENMDEAELKILLAKYQTLARADRNSEFDNESRETANRDSPRKSHGNHRKKDLI